MNNLSLNFFGEKVDIKIPDSLVTLRQQISEKFLFSPSEAAEILISYGKDLGKRLIQTENDFEDFIKKKILNVDLDVDPNSQIFQKSLLKLQTESEENKKNLEEMLKQIDEVKKKKETKKEEAKCVIDEFDRTIKELEKKKKEMIQQIDNEIKFTTSEMNKVKKNSEKEIKSLEKKENDLNKKADSLKVKLGIPVEKKKPKLKSRAKPKPKPKEKKLNPKNPQKLAETIKVWSDFLKLNSEQIANNISQKYEFFKNCFAQHPNEEIHYQYICDGCEMAPIKGVRYHCEKCPDFDLCEKCFKEKKEQHGHSFQAIKKSTVFPPKKPAFTKFCDEIVHRGVTCDGCGKHPLVGIRYKCGVCPNFDYCEECEKKEAMKHGHPMVRMPFPNMLRSIKINLKESSKKELENDEKIEFTNISCDGCGAKSIQGTRYKCSICRNFDYCEKCLHENLEKHNHPFIKIYHQKMQLASIKVIVDDDVYNKKPEPKKEENKEEKKEEKKVEEKKEEEKKPVHLGVQCNGCKKYPIVGCRYKCAVCLDFDYCEECEKKFNQQHLHPFIKIYKPEMKLESIKCIVDEKCPDYQSKKK